MSDEEVDDFEEVPFFEPNKKVSQSSDTCSLSHDSDSHDSITSKNSPKRRKKSKYISFILRLVGIFRLVYRIFKRQSSNIHIQMI